MQEGKRLRDEQDRYPRRAGVTTGLPAQGALQEPPAEHYAVGGKRKSSMALREPMRSMARPRPRRFEEPDKG